MSRILVVCCDGTANQFGTNNTNVVRLVQVLGDDPPGSQLVYYDPGIGTLAEPGLATRAGRWISEKVDLAFATGLLGKVERAYTYVADVWQPGDRVFLFGFSRGAYTARVLAALLHSIGLLPPRSQNLVPYAVRLFASLDARRGGDGDAGDDPYWRLCDEFRNTFARPLPGTEERRFPIAFLGVWDTVSSVGWVWDPKAFPFTSRNPSVKIARHAIALDERRAFYRQNRIFPVHGQDAEERWFCGVHSDVGGGYPESEGSLWRIPFEWMVREAMDAGLTVDGKRLERRLGGEAVRPPWQEPIHTSLRRAWWVAELWPKLPRSSRGGWRMPRFGLGRSRTVEAGAMLHRSVLERIHHQLDYRPANLTPGFCEAVRKAPPEGDAPHVP
jgi:uncharacterized protein (DUF2235 family)